MKYNLNRRTKKYATSMFLITLISISFFSCTKNFQDLNTNPYGISDASLLQNNNLLGGAVTQMQLNIFEFNSNAQLQQNLMADAFSGLMVAANPYKSNVNNMSYFLVDGWNNRPWTVAYNSVMAPTIKALLTINSTPENKAKYVNFESWIRILKVMAMHRVSDIYGPIIYTKYGIVQSDGSYKYDSQKDAYYAFFKDLDTAITNLSALADDKGVAFKSFDLAFDGTYTKWIELANSLRLRLALRISNVDIAKAKEEANKAMTLNKFLSSDFIINSKTISNPLNTFVYTWGETRMGADMESIMGGYNDPRLSKYVVFPESGQTTTYKGIRRGVNMGTLKERNGMASRLVDFGTSYPLMPIAEVKFLLAEATLPPMSISAAGDSKTLYEEGIKASFKQWNAGDATTYLASTPVPKNYVDLVTDAGILASQGNASMNAVSTITPTWTDATTDEQKREKIITQKWIAVYPNGQEAWSEWRRTGYPKLFPNNLNNSGGSISTNRGVRRINFSNNELLSNPKGVAAAVELLKTESTGILDGVSKGDNGGTTLWWDVK